jgi:hypothetical protein
MGAVEYIVIGFPGNRFKGEKERGTLIEEFTAQKARILGP